MQLRQLSESSKRTLRTAYVVLATLAIAVPAVILEVPKQTPGYQLLAAVGAGIVAVNRVVTYAEDRGLLPAFLRDVAPRLDVIDTVASAAADAAAVLSTHPLTLPASSPLAPVVHAVEQAAPVIADAAAALEQQATPGPG